MSKELAVTFSCGYEVVYPLNTRDPLPRTVRRSFEMSAEVEHDERCQRCREENEEK